MAFTVTDVRDLIRLLAEHPEWRAELRPLILGDEFDRLPAIVAELAEAQRRTEAVVSELAEAQRRTEAMVSELAEAQRRTEIRLLELGNKIDGLSDRMDQDTGSTYEVLFDRKAPSLFGEWLRRPRVVSLSDLDRVDDAETAGQLSEHDRTALHALDMIVSGRDRDAPGQPETLLAVEVSRTLDIDDLDWAEERAKILGSIGYRARAAVGGRFASERIRELATERDIILRLVDQSR